MSDELLISWLTMLREVNSEFRMWRTVNLAGLVFEEGYTLRRQICERYDLGGSDINIISFREFLMKNG